MKRNKKRKSRIVEKNNKKSELINEKEKSEVTENSDDKMPKLNFSQRKDRFLVVTTVMGVLIIVLKFLMQMSIDLFDTIYIHNINIFGLKDVFISQEQIISVLYISACICILIVFLTYCVCELYNFQSAERNSGWEEEADNWYALVFKVAMTLFVSNSITSMIVMLIFSDEKIYLYLFIIIVILSVILLIVLIKKFRKAIWKIILVISVNGVLAFFLFLYIFVGIHNEMGTLNISFENNNIIMEFEGYYYPEEIKCTIEGKEQRWEQSYLFDVYGEYACIEKITAIEKGKDDNTKMRENYYYYKYLLDINNSYDVGSYEIDLTFEINNTEYHIGNMFYYEDGNFDYTKNLMQRDL